jgi:uncharacterized membrane protein YgdD (TMEM256/DUF423 family)
VSPVLLGAVLGALGVLAGAFGAHGLKGRLEPDALASFETGVRYQLVHALALLAVGALARGDGGSFRVPTVLFLLGTLLFSGSIYALVLGGPRWLGPVTPLGGALLIAGWVALAFAAREHVG